MMLAHARTQPEPRHTDAAGLGPTVLQLARASAVVTGGPLALVLLSATAPFAAARRWPDRLPPGVGRKAGWAVTAAGLVAPWVYGTAVRPWLQHWGSTAEERRQRYPGDTEGKLLFTVTRAVTVNAPAEEVWRWLVQIGQDRGGFYSYDWLENLAGCRLRSAEKIHPEWQDLKPGEELKMLPRFGTPITAVDPPRSLLIENWGAYVVEPIDGHSCRLIARTHMDRTAAAVGYVLLFELPHAIMERKMLLGIKQRAEAATERATADHAVPR